jgi:hypothetical protein
MRRNAALAAAALGVLLQSTAGLAAGPTRDENDIRARLRAYAPVRLRADIESLGAGEKKALEKLVAAVDAIDAIYWKQMGRQALEARQAFEKATNPVDLLYRDFVRLNYGPFDILDAMERFVDTPTGGPRLPGAGFYPEDMTREEFEARLEAHPELEEEFRRRNTVIRRVDGVLVAIPYERIWLDDLTRAARAVQEAAAMSDSPSLRRYLSLRAEAMLKGDYYPSDRAWLEVKDNAIDLVIGPIETHDDALLGLKGSYEGAALVKDVRGSRSLDVYLKNLDGMSRALPVADAFKKATTGAGNVLEVMNVVRFGGDFNAGIKTVAASLPNDERVIQEKGAKKHIYRNVLEAKFDVLLTPIARIVLDKKAWPLVTREAFVTNVILHELSHALGVEYVAGRSDLTVRKALKDRHAAIEEAKADVVGIGHLAYLRDQEVFVEEEVQECYTTYLTGLLRSLRFGIEETHGRSSALQLNYLRKAGGVLLDAKKGEFSLSPKHFEPAIRTLSRELLEIEGTGDYERAGRLLEEFGRLDDATRTLLLRTETVPVDVTFIYPV